MRETRTRPRDASPDSPQWQEYLVAAARSHHPPLCPPPSRGGARGVRAGSSICHAGSRYHTSLAVVPTRDKLCPSSAMPPYQVGTFCWFSTGSGNGHRGSLESFQRRPAGKPCAPPRANISILLAQRAAVEPPEKGGHWEQGVACLPISASSSPLCLLFQAQGHVEEG